MSATTDTATTDTATTTASAGTSTDSVILASTSLTESTASTTSSTPAVPQGVAYKGVTEAMWNEIEAVRNQSADPNDCRARVNAIPTTGGITISPSTGNAINSALSSSNTVYLRAGTYVLSSQIDLVGKQLIGIPGEDVVIDASNVMTAFWMSNDSLLANVRIINAGNYGVSLWRGNNNLIYRVSVGRTGYDSRINGHGVGIIATDGASYNCIVSTEVFDSYNEDGGSCGAVCANGGNADGIVVSYSSHDNTIIDSYSYRNGDDGIDFWEGGNVSVYFSSSFDNGKTTGKTITGDGNGFKLGIGSARRYIYKSSASNNKRNGYENNGNTGENILVQTTASGNGGVDYSAVSPQ